MFTHCPICLNPLNNDGDCWNGLNSCEYESALSDIKPLTKLEALRQRLGRVRHSINTSKKYEKRILALIKQIEEKEDLTEERALTKQLANVAAINNHYDKTR